MAARLIAEDFEGDTRIRWYQDGEQITIQHTQDMQPLLDEIASINADGGAPTNDGIGALKYEFPETLIMEHAIERGLSFSKLAFEPSKDMDKEWEAMARKWSKLSIERQRQYYGIS